MLPSFSEKYRCSYGVLYVEKNKTKGMDFSIISLTKHTCRLRWCNKHHEYSNGNQLYDPHDREATFNLSFQFFAATLV